MLSRKRYSKRSSGSPPTRYYTVTVEAQPDDAGTVNGGGVYARGDYAVVYATVGAGYRFVSWTENGSIVSYSSMYGFDVYQDRHLVANFELAVILTLSTSPEGIGSTTGAGTYPMNTSVYIYANVPEGYNFSHWEENGEVYSYMNYILVTLLSTNRHLTAVLEVIEQFQVTLSIEPVNAGTVTGNGNYFSGDMVTVRAFPENDYNFLQWNDENGNFVSDMRVFSFLISENTHLEAVFELKEVETCDEFEIECSCSLSFDSYLNNTISVLSVGNLVAGDCEFEEYLIDWYRDGEHALVSGVGNDPEIEAFHPFIGDAAIPVLPGTWVPRVRYVVINGERVYAYNQAEEPCQKWCTLLQDLPVIIVVEPINCLTVNTDNGLYSFTLSYKTEMDFSLASRTVKFELPDDGSAAYLAFMFEGIMIADRIEIFLNDSLEPLTSWIVGWSATNSQYDVMPYIHGQSSIKYVLALPEYLPDSYLLIRITPSVLDNNINTEWTLRLKCLGIDTEWGCDYPTPEMQEITDISIVEDTVNCRNLISITKRELFKELYPNTPHPMANMRDYAGLSNTYSSSHSISGTVDEEEKKEIVYISNKASYNMKQWKSVDSPSEYVNCSSVLHISKTGNKTTFQCTSSDDYNAFYDSYSALMLTGYITEYVNDNTNYRYYRQIGVFIRLSQLNCGDQSSGTVYFVFHPSAIFSFDPNQLKIEVITSEVVFGLPYLECDDSYDYAEVLANNINQYHNKVDFNVSTMCRVKAPLGSAAGSYESIPIGNIINFSKGSIIWHRADIQQCEDLNMFCINQELYPKCYIFYSLFLRLIYTGDLPKYENYEIHNLLNSEGCYDPSNPVLIYKVENGVVTVNNLPYKPIQP